MAIPGTTRPHHFETRLFLKLAGLQIGSVFSDSGQG